MKWSVLSREAKVFVGLVAVEAVTVAALTVQDLVANAPWTAANRFHYEFGILFLVCTLAAAYFGISGAVRENALELAIFCFALLLADVYVLYAIISPGAEARGGKVSPHSPAAYIRVVLVSLATIASLPASYVVHQAFGWRAYKTVGASVEMTTLYERYVLLMGSLKLDALVSFITLYIAGMTLLHERGLIADSIALVVTWAGLAAAAYGARHESRKAVAVFFVIAVLEPAYIVWKLSTTLGSATSTRS
ncbi:uncharacterized protein AMSG_06409 [Thecamonas trahens ATCC 50062]|uniref:Uncharacterized protein n=1 Tax=Thecamonas trahens ATCC 50062 TaxID=461836 RepID=A0A0L0DFY8_THETB|nr:hypothetical protein AMSG_06409 [Thecamonas trahens ATCC 50062]KNC50253.1 hypothetical protein AMSG_06409 [Thecamonas trahens ATCC 50062]|eukprot:XP_013757082.1 hypothetical protein AMSG_06409 [Thecamonas trahens ATCC 50062]